MNTSGKKMNCTTAGAASALLMRLATATPSAQNAAAPMTRVTMMAAQWPWHRHPVQQAHPHDQRRVDEATMTQCATSPTNITQAGSGVPRSRSEDALRRRSDNVTASCE